MAAVLILALFGVYPEARSSEAREDLEVTPKVVITPITDESPWVSAIQLDGLPIVSCSYVGEEPPKIDGELGDWEREAIRWTVLDDAVHYAGDNWTGPEDCSFRIAFAYDKDHLYVAAELTDNFSDHSFKGSDIWRGDSFQLGLDPLLDRAKDHWAGDDIEIGWAISPEGDRVLVWRWQGGSTLPTGPLDVPAAFQVEGAVTRFELAVPFVELGRLAPGLFAKCGVTFMANDNDGEGREGYVEWTPSLGAKKDPSTFGLLEFGEAPAGVVPNEAAQFEWIKNVTAKGNYLELRIHVMARAATEDGTLSAILMDGEERTEIASQAVPVVAGHQAYMIQVDTSEIPEGRHALAVKFTTPAGLSIETDRSIYVYPPVRWVE
jgi:hypothetical protein